MHKVSRPKVFPVVHFSFHVDIFALFSFVFRKTQSWGPFCWAVNHCVLLLVRCRASKHVSERHGGTPRQAKVFKTKSVPNAEM